MNKNLRLSIVIPVYNEERQLAACLRSIAAQTRPAYEVIVVDNNSTDATAAVAAGFNFVRLVREPRQGVVHARTRGFNVARGDIIARLDGDTILPVNWTETLISVLSDPTIMAVSGAPHYYDFALPAVADKIDHVMRAHLASRLGNENFLYGANMAVRRQAWLKVRSELCLHKGLHEDFDLAIHLQRRSYRVFYAPQLIAGVSSRRISTDFPSYWRYTMISPRTYARHGLKSRRYMYSALTVAWLCHPAGRLLQRLYDQKTARLKLSQLFYPPAVMARVNPATFVD